MTFDKQIINLLGYLALIDLVHHTTIKLNGIGLDDLIMLEIRYRKALEMLGKPKPWQIGRRWIYKTAIEEHNSAVRLIALTKGYPEIPDTNIVIVLE